MALQDHRRGIGAMSTGHSAFQVRAHCGAALTGGGLLRLILRGMRQRAFAVCRQAVAPKRVDMSGNINLRTLAVRSRGKIRHHVALNRQYLPILFRCPVSRLPGLPLTENGPRPEYVRLISGRRASWNLLMERHGVMSFSEGIRATPSPNQDIKDRRRWSLLCIVLSEQYCSPVARRHRRGIAALQGRTMASTPARLLFCLGSRVTARSPLQSSMV